MGVNIIVTNANNFYKHHVFYIWACILFVCLFAYCLSQYIPDWLGTHNLPVWAPKWWTAFTWSSVHDHMWLRSQTFLQETGNLKKSTHVQKGRELEATALCPWEEDDCSRISTITEPSAVEITSGKPPAWAGSMKSTAAAKSTRQNCLDWSKKMSIGVMYSHFVSLHLELIFQYKALSTPPHIPLQSSFWLSEAQNYWTVQTAALSISHGSGQMLGKIERGETYRNVYVSLA